MATVKIKQLASELRELEKQVESELYGDDENFDSIALVHDVAVQIRRLDLVHQD